MFIHFPISIFVVAKAPLGRCETFPHFMHLAVLSLDLPQPVKVVRRFSRGFASRKICGISGILPYFDHMISPLLWYVLILFWDVSRFLTMEQVNFGECFSRFSISNFSKHQSFCQGSSSRNTPRSSSQLLNMFKTKNNLEQKAYPPVISRGPVK